MRAKGTSLARLARAIATLAAVAFFPAPLSAQPLSSTGKLCGISEEAIRAGAALPASVRALRERKQLRVLAIGSTPLATRDQDKGAYAIVESFLESNLKGLDVEVIDRGVSGELAQDAAARIRNEVALTEPDVVFWQVGAADALARTPPAELKATLVEAIAWIKAHDVDVVLIGMRYIRAMAKDPHYQEIRRAIRDAQREQGILRVGHYEAVETLDSIRRQQGAPPTELDLTEAGATCMAEFLSRALAAKLFAKPTGHAPPGAALSGPGSPPRAAPADGPPAPPKGQ